MLFYALFIITYTKASKLIKDDRPAVKKPTSICIFARYRRNAKISLCRNCWPCHFAVWMRIPKVNDITRVVKHSDEVNISSLISSSYWIAREATKTSHTICPDYLEALLADGRLTIGLGIGTQDLGDIRVPDQPEKRVCRQKLLFFGKMVDVQGRLEHQTKSLQQLFLNAKLCLSSHIHASAQDLFFTMMAKPGHIECRTCHLMKSLCLKMK